MPHTSKRLVMTPICPYKYHVQSIILPKDEKTYIDINHDNSPYGITIDGQTFLEFNELKKQVVIENADVTLDMIYPTDYNFYKLLEKKLNFGGTFAK